VTNLIPAVLTAGFIFAEPPVWPAAPRTAQPTEPCSALISTLVPQLIFGRTLADLRRVELRSCQPGVSGNLQVLAWEARSQKPSLIVETYDFTVIQLFMRHNVFLIETARDAYNTVTIIVYDKSKPRLALQKTVRDPASLQVTGGEVRVTLTETNGQTETHAYRLTPN
jgi:hypothetical protein